MEARKYRFIVSITLTLLIFPAGARGARIEILVEENVGTHPNSLPLHRYNFTFNYTEGEGNPDNPLPVAGWSLVNAFSQFGVRANAEYDTQITAPNGWDFLPPIFEPPVHIDSLDYFSLSAQFDVNLGARLGGFSFLSITNPPEENRFCPALYQFEAVDQSGRTFQPFCFVIPEPSTLILCLLPLLARARRSTPRAA